MAAKKTKGGADIPLAAELLNAAAEYIGCVDRAWALRAKRVARSLLGLSAKKLTKPSRADNRRELRRRRSPNGGK